MKTFNFFILLTLSSFSETYISNSVILNSTINDKDFNNKSTSIKTSKNIPISPFNKIEIDTPADVTINYDNRREVTLDMESKLIDKIKIYVKEETLFIRTEGSFNSQTGIKITINNPRLNSLIVDGASTVNIDGYNEENFSLKVDGSSDIYFGSGSFNNFSIDADGSYDINLLKVDIEKAKIRADGTGDIKVKANSYLNVNLDGNVEVKYLGNPKIKKRVKDISDLTHI